MQEVQKNILGFDIKVKVASTLTELAELAGSEVRAVELANNYVLFHQAFGAFRSLIVDCLVKATGVKMLTEGEGEDEVVIEKEAAYVDRIQREHGVKLSDYAEQVQALIDANPASYKATRSASAGPKKLAIKYIDAANELISTGKAELFANKYGLDISGVEGEALVTLIANKVREVIIEQQRKAAEMALAL